MTENGVKRRRTEETDFCEASRRQIAFCAGDNEGVYRRYSTEAADKQGAR